MSPQSTLLRSSPRSWLEPLSGPAAGLLFTTTLPGDVEGGGLSSLLLSSLHRCWLCAAGPVAWSRGHGCRESPAPLGGV
eukprot:9426910-Pyramimonas_sp.AAC.1